MLDKNAKIYVAGHRGLVGSAICRRLAAGGYGNVVVRSHAELDLTDPAAVDGFFREEKPEYVMVAAARVGGIMANATRPVDFLRDNVLIQTNVLHGARLAGSRKTLLLGSSCIYPRLAPQPMKEECLLTSPLEPTNQCYAIAKIAGLMLGQAYRRQYGMNVIAAMPTNLYGPGDNFDLATSHVLPALIRRFYEAKQSGAASVVLWGTGEQYREFLHVDDLADACVFLMDHYDAEELINVGVGREITIRDLAEMIKSIVGYGGGVEWDSGKPGGTPRKLLDVSRLRDLGWEARIPLREGVEATCRWYGENYG